MMLSIDTESNPNGGIYLLLSQSHAWDSGIGRLSRVTPREILSANLSALMASGRWPKLTTIRKIADASGVANGTVGRMVAGSHTTDIDKIEGVAKVFGLQPWQLLVEGLNPQALPMLADSAFLHNIRELVSAQMPVTATNLDADQVGQATPTKSLTLDIPASEYSASGSPSVGSRRLSRVPLPEPHTGPSKLTPKGQQRERSTNRKRGQK